MNPTDNLSLDWIEVVASKGARDDHCLRDAAVLAIEQQCKVKLTHNGVQYTIFPDVMLATITSQIVDL